LAIRGNYNRIANIDDEIGDLEADKERYSCEIEEHKLALSEYQAELKQLQKLVATMGGEDDVKPWDKDRPANEASLEQWVRA